MRGAGSSMGYSDLHKQTSYAIIVEGVAESAILSVPWYGVEACLLLSVSSYFLYIWFLTNSIQLYVH